MSNKMLVDWVETYVQLSGQDALELQRLLDLEGNKEIKTMELTWLGQAEARGIEQGIEKGITQGAEIATRQAVERIQQVVLRQIERRFGSVPAAARQRIEAMHALEPLATLAERVPFVHSIADLGVS